MRALKFITGHVIYNPANTYKFQLKTTIDNKSVRIHVQSVHMKEKPHLCPSCGKGFGTPISLKSHRENVHEKLKKYPCKVCGKTFGNQGNLYVHNQRHHERYVLAVFFY